MSQRTERTGLLSAWLQAAANIATLIVACLLSIVLVKNYLLPGPVLLRSAVPAPVSDRANLPVGKDLKSQVPGVNWSQNGETVLLALSTHCHFCTDSAPFFRQLSEKSGKTFKIVAILPEPAAEAQNYLRHEGVHVDELRQISLDKLGVAGTPTMLLLDDRGTVTESWVGMLNPEAQTQALKAITAAHVQKKTGEL